MITSEKKQKDKITYDCIRHLKVPEDNKEKVPGRKSRKTKLLMMPASSLYVKIMQLKCVPKIIQMLLPKKFPRQTYR